MEKSIFAYMIEPYKKYAVFSGRARRKEFWFFQLFLIIVSFILSIFDGLFFGTGVDEFGVLHSAFDIGSLIPSIAVGVRRLHDTGRRGWWMLLWLLPVIGWVWIIVLMCLPGTTGKTQYGANPIGAKA